MINFCKRDANRQMDQQQKVLAQLTHCHGLKKLYLGHFMYTKQALVLLTNVIKGNEGSLEELVVTGPA